MIGNEAEATEALRAKWDERYAHSDRSPPPAALLAQNLHLLPPAGRALDLACGVGANALLLAEQGLETSAWDLAPVAIEHLRRQAEARGLTIDAEVRDVLVRPPEPQSFDVIVVAHFLDRGLMTAIADALRTGGLLFYQSFSREAVSDLGPSNPSFRLDTNELLRLFPGLVVRVYREEGRIGDLSRGMRDLAMLIAERPM